MINPIYTKIYTKINKYRSPTIVQTMNRASKALILLSVFAVIQPKKPILLRSGIVVMEFVVNAMGRERSS